MSDAASIVRPLGPADRAGWQPLWRDYLAFYRTALPEATYDAAFARLTDPAEPAMAAFVAEAGGRLVGLAHYLFHVSCWSPAPKCYLQDLFTLPAMRGQGVATALIAAVTARAKAAGAYELYWLTAEDNAPARRVYDRVAALTPYRLYKQTW